MCDSRLRIGTRQDTDCCLSHLDGVWHDSLVVAVESLEDGTCELSWVHLVRLLSEVVFPGSGSVNSLTFHP